MPTELSMNGRKKIETIQKEFTNKFNYLTLLFLDENRKSLDISRSLAEVRTVKGTDVSINAGLKVNTLEARFMQHYGLLVEVAYKKDGKVMHTKETVDKTLNELNRWCEENGCENFEFKKSLRGDTVYSLQEQLFHAITEVYPNAVAKKINKDNFMDVHLPSVNPKRGTHLFFNTAKEGIKFGFYCRDKTFNYPILERSSAVEAYAQGIRPTGNPLFTNVEEAAEAVLSFICELMGLSSITPTQKSNPVIAAFVSEWQENCESICQLLDGLGTEEGKMSVYNVGIEVLSSLNLDDVPKVDNLEFMGEVEIDDWDGLGEIIGTEEAEVNKKEYSADNLSDTSKIVFLYSSGEYVFSFLNPGEGNGEIDSMDNEEEYIDNTDDNYQSDTEIKSVKIGNQVWMAENLNVDKFRNGDMIPQAKTAKEWEAAGDNKEPAWCYYENKESYGEKYGKLYNWHAVTDPRGLAPVGWHIPSDEEWEKLTEYLGGEDEAGEKMKSTSGWSDWEDEDGESNDGNGTNESEFNGLPSGNRTYFGTFINICKYSFWWSSTVSDTDGAWDRSLNNNNSRVDRGDNYGTEGFSVRCIRN